MSTAKDFEKLSKPQQRAVIDLVGEGGFYRNEAGWQGRYTHRPATIDVLASRGFAVKRFGSVVRFGCVPTKAAQRMLEAVCAETNEIIRRSEATR